jgi:hypothetical protein
VQVNEASLWSKDVQRLLWAAGEARARGRRREQRRPAAASHVADPPAPAADAGFFTEWQPAAH